MNIEKLLSSTVLEDVLIGIELAYKHWSDDQFHDYFHDFHNNLSNYTHGLYYEFYRDNTRYVIGNAKIVKSYGKLIVYDYIDITPK